MLMMILKGKLYCFKKESELYFFEKGRTLKYTVVRREVNNNFERDIILL